MRDERGFAGSVLTHQPVDLDRMHAGVGFGDVAHGIDACLSRYAY